MKVSTLILFLAGAVLAWIAFTSEGRQGPTAAGKLPLDAPIPTRLSGTIPAGYVERVFDVEGMCCNGCPRGLYEKVIGVEGVAEAAASYDTQTVSAVVPEDFAVDALTSVLQSAKYSATLRTE